MELAFKDSSLKKLQNHSQVLEAHFQLFHLVTYLNIMEHKSGEATAKTESLEKCSIPSEMQMRPGLIIDIQYFIIVL